MRCSAQSQVSHPQAFLTRRHLRAAICSIGPSVAATRNSAEATVYWGMTMSATTVPTSSSGLANRWVQLVLGLIAMVSISSPQYVWTLFTGPLNQKLGTTLAELQWTFSLLIILQTWCSPLQAYLVDRFGPRMLISIGALMSGGGWVLSSYVDNIWALYFTYGVICG